MSGYRSIGVTTLLSLTSSLLYILAFPNFNHSGLAWVALVPLALATRHLSPRRSFLWGWLSGTLAYMGILYWIIVTFQAAHLSVSLAAFCLLLLSGYLGLYWGVWAWYLAFSKQESKDSQQIRSQKDVFLISDLLALLALPALKTPLAGAAAWVALEYLRTYLFSGFPWALLGDSQVHNLMIIQIASITGVYGVSFLIMTANLAIAEWKWRPALLAFSLVVLSAGYGSHRLNSFAKEKPGQPIKVALLQGDIDQYKKWDKAYIEEIQKTYEDLVQKAGETKPDIVLWPETSVPGYLFQEAPLRDWLLKTIRSIHASHLVGAPYIQGNKAYNSAFSLNHEGKLEGQYAKVHLVPFGEIVPWSNVLGRFIRVLNDLGGFAAGEQPSVVPLHGYPVGVNICYEAIFPNLVRQSVKQGAVLLANLTNDGWYMKTSAPYQHWAPNIFRAVENGRWLIRADNTGISGIIDPAGRVQATSQIFEPCVIIGKVVPHSNQTLYTQWGDWFAWLCSFFTVCLFIRSQNLK